VAATDTGFVRRFPILWGMLTATYGLAVAYRAVAQSVAPGLPTLAALSAIAAVWLGFFEFDRTHRYLHVAIVLTLVATILLNTAAILSSAMHGRGVPAEQSIFTIIFLYVLVGRLQQFQTRHSSREQQT
jgi:hypothetical protein